MRCGATRRENDRSTCLGSGDRRPTGLRLSRTAPTVNATDSWARNHRSSGLAAIRAASPAWINSAAALPGLRFAC
jgi:hypothetical protein